MMTERSFLKNF